MKYLITGITGFAGPHLANLLIREGHEVYGLIRCSNGRENDIRDIVRDENFSKITFLYSDICNLNTLRKIFKSDKFDGVFHLAAQSHPTTSFADPIGTFKSNIIGSANLIEAISENQPECRLMFCSTSEIYGNLGKDQHLLKEDDFIMPTNPYGVSKAAIDIYMQERMTNKKIKGFITRAFSHTGPRRGRNFSISSDAFQLVRMKKCAAEKVLSIGNLETVRVVADVRDIVRAYYLLMSNPETNGQIYNICGEIPRKMEFYTNKLIEISKLEEVEKKINPLYYRKIDIQYQCGNSSKLKQVTGWKEEYVIEQTLTDLFNYWMEKIWVN